MARVVRCQIRCLVGPTQTRERHQPGRKPGIKDVVILTYRAPAAGTPVEVGSAHTGYAAGSIIAVPDRYAVTPPQLARDAPVPNALEPRRVILTPSLRHESNGAIAVRRQRRTGEWLHPDEPLIGEPRLDNSVATVAVPNRVTVRFYSFEQPGALEFRDHLPASLVAVQALKAIRSSQADARFGRHHI